jgi:glycosyltransferase involved in cell wall biosynthesis
MTPRVVHILPQHDTTGAMSQSRQVARALSGEFESVDARLGFEIPWRGGFDPAGWRALRMFLDQQHPAVIHFWLAANDTLPIALVPGRLRARLVASWREWESGIRGKHQRWLTRRLDHVLAPTAGLAARFQAAGVDSRRTVVVPEMLSPPLARHEERASFLARHGLSPEMRIVVAGGRWRWSDRWKDLIWSADICQVMRDDVCLVLFGHGEDMTRLQRYRAQLEIADHVLFGSLDELPEWLTHADVAWSARDDAGVSPELLAAANSGVPIVATATPCHRQLFTHDRDALLIRIGDRADLVRQTARILDNPTLAESLQTAATERVRGLHHSATIAAQYAAIYAGT